MAMMYRKPASFGGEGGSEWDDDVYEGVKKVYVGQDRNCITYIKFEYVKKDGEVVTREHGIINQPPNEFVVEYPDEHIISVEAILDSVVSVCGTYVLTALTFKTSKGKISPKFGRPSYGYKKFVFENDQKKKIVGFHGRSGNAIDALGVYFAVDCLATTPFPLYKLEAQGGTYGQVWDDGSYDGVKTVRIGTDSNSITYLEFEYVKGGKSETRHHGVKGKRLSEFVLDFPDEYIKSVEATYDKTTFFRKDVIRSLTFQTSKGRKSVYGYKSGKTFVLQQKDRRLVGFHGSIYSISGDTIESLGAYFAPIAIPIPTTKLPLVGGNGGVTWDDGVHDSVRKIYVGQGTDGVSFVKFEYTKGKDLVSGDDHGKKSVLGAEEFVLEDGEYLTAVEGYFEKIYGIEEPLIISLKFTTNKRESAPFGMTSGEKFFLGEKGHKIVGFQGRACDVVHAIGVTIVPITTTK